MADFPLKQGALDFLCGVYAAINAMYVRGEVDDLDEASIPFRLALNTMQANKDWDLAASICHGIDEGPYNELLVKLSWREWRDPIEDPEADALEALFHERANEPGFCVIVSIIEPGDLGKDSHEREVIHYTVVTGITGEAIHLADSMAASEMKRKGEVLEFTFAGEPAKPVRLGKIFVPDWWCKGRTVADE